MANNKQESSSLVLTLEVQEPVIVGLSALGTLRVTNRATTPITISARLNLMEGDVRLIVTGPDGNRRDLRGWQADTILRQVDLAPNEQLVANLNLLQTEEGPVFQSPGRYQLQAEFSPSLQSEAITSPPVVVNARAPQTDAERGVAQLLSNDRVRQSIVLAQDDASPDELVQLAEKFPETLDGKLAQLIRAGTGKATAEFDSLESSLSTAPLISALNTPFSRVGSGLADEFATKIAAFDEAKDGGERSDIDAALGLVKGNPIKV
jgi:hypothetical protein